MLQRMQELDKDGIVFVLPETTEDRQALGKALETLLGVPPKESSGPPHERALALQTWLEVVYGVASADAVAAKKGEDIVLVDRRGRRLAGGRFDRTSFASMMESLRALLEREPHASARRARVPAKEVEALRTLFRTAPARDYQHRRAEIAEDASRFAPVLRDDVKPFDGEPSEEQVKVFYGVFFAWGAAWANGVEHGGGAPSVFGARWTFERYDPCPTCGMMSSAAYTRTFLDFVAEVD